MLMTFDLGFAKPLTSSAPEQSDIQQALEDAVVRLNQVLDEDGDTEDEGIQDIDNEAHESVHPMPLVPAVAQVQSEIFILHFFSGRRTDGVLTRNKSRDQFGTSATCGSLFAVCGSSRVNA